MTHPVVIVQRSVDADLASPSPSRRSAGDGSMTLRLGLVLGTIATLLWCAFLTFLGKSIYILLSTGDWPTLSLSSSFDVAAAGRFGDAWLGWYFLGATIATMVVAICCVAANRRRSTR